MGGTMRLGKRRTIFKTEDSVLRKLYKPEGDYVDERHRHRYEVNPEYTRMFEEQGLHFVGQDEDGERMEVVELDDHPYYVAVQFHPEFLSRPLSPSPVYLGLILASAGKLKNFLSRGARLSPQTSFKRLSSCEDLADVYENNKMASPDVLESRLADMQVTMNKNKSNNQEELAAAE